MQTSAQRFYFPDLFRGWKGFLHILFWLVHLLIRSGFSQYHSSEFLENFWIELVELPIKMFIAYTLIFLIERFIKSSKFREFIVGVFICLVIGWFLKRVHDWYLVFPGYSEAFQMSSRNFWDVLAGFNRLIYVYPTVVGITAMTYTIEWFQKEQRNKELEKLTMQNELKYLKSQIQPHFLFNTLNNLYALSLEESKKTPKVILQLSEMLSFMLYQSEKKLVLLKDEIELIENLYALESIRTSQPIEFSFQRKDINEMIMIPPLLIFPLAENAFKYGIGDEGTSGRIIVELTVQEDDLIFSTRNIIKKEIKAEENQEKGIGLSTLKRRLELLYPNRYKLEYFEKEGEFITNLQFPLKSI